MSVTDPGLASTARGGWWRKSFRHEIDVVGHVLLIVHLSGRLGLPAVAPGGVVVAEDQTNRFPVTAVKVQDCLH